MADLVEYYDRQWDVFSGGVVYVDRAFTYVNRHYVRAEKNSGNTNIDTALNVCIPRTRKYSADTRFTYSGCTEELEG